MNNVRFMVCTPLLFVFQALNFLVESFGLLNDLFPLPSILDAGYPVFDLHLYFSPDTIPVIR